MRKMVLFVSVDNRESFMIDEFDKLEFDMKSIRF